MRSCNLDKILNIFGTIVILFCPFFTYANESYLAFSSNGYLKQNGELFINEEFIYDYDKNAKHGLFRNIPLVYEDTHDWFGIKTISVKDKDGKPYKFEINDPGNVSRIKIGDPEITLTGSHYYNINYSLVNIAKNESLKWKIVENIREPITKFQAQLFLPRSIPLFSATASCVLLSKDSSRNCDIEPLISTDKVVGYKIFLENITNEDVIFEVKYSPGLVFIAKAKKADDNFLYKHYLIIIATILLSTFFIYIFRNKFAGYYLYIKKPHVEAEHYSYLSRGVYRSGKILDEDIIASIVDLRDRGYLSLEQKSTPVGLYEFIDYTVTIISDDFPDGAEGYLLSLFIDNVLSLNDWFNNITESERENIKNLSFAEIRNVRLVDDITVVPQLEGFKLFKK